MFRRLQHLRDDRIASETLEHQSTSSILPNDNLQTGNSRASLQPSQQPHLTSSTLPSGRLLPVVSASEAEALQSLDSHSESESSLESAEKADFASRKRADETEVVGNLDYRTLPSHGAGHQELHRNLDKERQNLDDELPFPLDAAEALQNLDYRVLPHGARQRSITYEVGPLGIRPLWTGGPWIQDDSDSGYESQELPQILEDEEIQQDLDTLQLDGLEWEEHNLVTSTTVVMPSVTDTVGSQNSKSDSSWGSVV
eukprot:TRINITY_DN533_c0_g3_i1.p1 TRINITY_DN533_c0_g3~~TRINITY_DN533_c0_g3_i1.p1  ORF type:complete len:255 (+),score=41.14 TRINITY_DN533_c0_g3_i1:110-874(+)